MQVIVKKDNRLVKLGEGRIYSKSQLKLNEDGKSFVNQNDTATQNRINSLVNKIPPQERSSYDLVIGKDNNGVNGQVDMSKIDDANTGTISNASNVQDAVSQSRQNGAKNPSNNAFEINVDDLGNNSGTINSSVASKKVMDEMRRNSIPFSKKELSSFLNSL